MLGIGGFKQRMVDPARALPGRDTPMPVRNVAPRACTSHRWRLHRDALGAVRHGLLLGRRAQVLDAARRVFTTAVGYAGGITPNPTYREVCSGETGHAEVVLVVFDPAQVSFDALLKAFWESHDPDPGHAPGQ
jgi:peptide-methionine (S)-S-oxide reductase